MGWASELAEVTGAASAGIPEGTVLRWRRRWVAGWQHTGDCLVGRVGSSLLLLTLAPWGALGVQTPPGRLGTQRSCRAEADGIFYPQTGILKDFTSHLLALSCGPFLSEGAIW